ncbi:transcriptional regulator [Chryseobacterium zhengzhouense]|uniref:Transcriptional regulator n=1 Tax=Chryseobacterium zhengzhouense TaxID=1636086 RepID=A0ABW2M4D5_9FLAO
MKISHCYSIRYILILAFWSCFFHAQKTNPKLEIDRLIKSTEQLSIAGKSDKVFAFSKKIIQLSQHSQYEKGLSYGYFFMASYYYDHAKFKLSIDNAKEAQKYSDYLQTDKTHAANISSLLAGNYLLLELYSLSFRNYRKTLEILISKKQKTSTDLLTESAAYSNLSYIYENINKQDSMYYYLLKEKVILKNIDQNGAYIQKGCSCLGFGNYHLKQNKIDSAQYYYNRSLQFFDGKQHPCKIESLIGLGNLYASQKNYAKAQKFYDDALASFNQNNFPDILSELYKKIAELKVSQGIPSEAKYFQDLYLKTNNDLDERMKKERDFALNQVMKEEKIKHAEEVKNNQRMTLIIVSFLIIITSFIIYLLKKSKYKTQKTIEIAEKLIREKELQEQEAHKLKQQLNEAFDEVIQLAKDNNPSFYTRFQEVYPKFQSKMLQLNESLKPSELTFAAYIYLGFTTKEIADYTFKAVKTIENNRYNFRKKINLSPEKDLQIWLRNHIDSE